MDLSALRAADPDVHAIVLREIRRQSGQLEMIASENFVSEAVLEAAGTPLTNKYAEGYPGRRYYAGCEVVDEVERLAIERAKRLFGCEHANVQPHSGSQANQAVYLATLKPGDVVLGLDLAHGGHLTHGSPVNLSGLLYRFVAYGVRREDHRIDYEALERLAREHRPRMIVTGASAYPRAIDFERVRRIAEEVGALQMADVAHYAGLVAAGLYPSPVPHADFTTTTTHKTLRGPRSGMAMCRAAHAKALDKAVFPGVQGGPLMHVVAAKAVAFGEALRPEFAAYQRAILSNAQALARTLLDAGLALVSGGTDCHLVLVDVTPKGLTGKEAEGWLEAAGITVNKNAIPFDPHPPAKAGGVRLGTPALTTRGMGEAEMRRIGGWIAEVLDARGDAAIVGRIRREVTDLCSAYPLYPSLS